jgi:hypothetical protein
MKIYVTTPQLKSLNDVQVEMSSRLSTLEQRNIEFETSLKRKASVDTANTKNKKEKTELNIAEKALRVEQSRVNALLKQSMKCQGAQTVQQVTLNSIDLAKLQLFQGQIGDMLSNLSQVELPPSIVYGNDHDNVDDDHCDTINICSIHHMIYHVVGYMGLILHS